jgi:hypothetical protein
MPSRSDGQASVELVALLPLVAMALAVAWQLVLAGEAVWAASAAARAAARAVAVGADPGPAARGRLAARHERGVRVRSEAGGSVVVSVRIPRVLPALPLGRVDAHSRLPVAR